MRIPLFVSLAAFAGIAHAQTTPYPILFVTQVPVPVDFATIGSTFANHSASPGSVYRGGDLWIRYTDGTLKNLTATAGFGSSAQFQGTDAIAVRDPAVHWNGTKAVFSMVVGAPTQQFEVGQYRWQLYEVTGLGAAQTPQIALVPNQPTQFNNVMPAYLSDGTIVFASDRPRNGAAHLYPQHDEYESAATVTGLWRLDPSTGDLTLLDHAPSGDFDPIVDSFGRLLFTRWDHLQRDQQADVPEKGTFDWADENANAAIQPTQTEVFPELRVVPDPSPINGHSFNQFFPWQVAQNGTDAEFLNHLGRHELLAYFNNSIATSVDSNIIEFISATSGRTNPNAIENVFQIAEDPTTPGRYVGIDAPEFDTHASGQLVRVLATPATNPDDVTFEYLTPRVTRGTAPDPAHSGHYRNPIVLNDGSIVVAHTAQTDGVDNLGNTAAPVPNYRFRLKLMTAGGGGFLTAGAPLTSGITKSVTWYTPDVSASYSGELWELSPVEVRARAVPPGPGNATLAAPEQAALAAASVSEGSLRQFLRQNNLGLVVVRNATHRDKADKQQPYQLRVPGGVQTPPPMQVAGTVYDVAFVQMFQGDQVRGIDGPATPAAGRRVLARNLHEPAALANNLPAPGGPAGRSPLYPDGSTAIFVPAQRALSWQTTAPDATPVVRERFWLTLQPGEIRVCTGCHGINRAGQAGQAPATNTPQALTALLQNWSTLNGGPLFADSFE
jgi:hypothetical protein